METHFLLAFGEGEFLAPLAMTGSEAFFNKLLEELRGSDLRNVRERALERLNRHKISTTLVVTLKKGLNDCEIGKIIDFALQQPCVRGVTFQPIQAAGRLEQYDPATDRLTLTE